MPEAFKAAGRIVHLSNCVLVFNEDGSFENKPFSPSFRSRNRSPIAYDPNAECPQFKTKILGHIEEDDRDLLQQYGGQCLLGRNHTQRILILDGIGSASKSTFVLLTRGVIGAANTYELRTKHLAERFEIGRMIGKTMLLGADVKANFLSEEGAYRLKALVGGDTLEAEPKTSNKRFSISGIFNVMLTCNSRLRVHLEGDESAWRRRLAIVRCEQPFNLPKIPDIDQISLRREGSGILNWFLEGTQKLLRSIQQTGDIALSTRQLERVHALLSESDSLRIYLRENLVRGQSGNLTVAEILERYTLYCISAEWSPVPVTIAQRQLDDLMLELFGTAKANNIEREGKAQRGFRYVRWRRDDESDPD